MSIIEFGDQLLRTGDLDPVYIAIHSAKLDDATLARLSLAYWCFYSLGTAAFIAERGKTPAKFWQLMETAVLNEHLVKGVPAPIAGKKPWPRGAERRHFRGDNAVKAYNDLRRRYRDPETAAWAMSGAARPGINVPFKNVSYSVQLHVGFGPWIAFKIADWSERVLGADVSFDDCHLGIYDDPRQGAAIAHLEGLSEFAQPRAEYAGRFWDYPMTDELVKATCDEYVAHWQRRKFVAPGGRPRLVNIQEIETIFCKYKSHLKGHYPLGKDTREIGHALEGWGDLAQQLKKGLP